MGIYGAKDNELPHLMDIFMTLAYSSLWGSQQATTLLIHLYLNYFPEDASAVGAAALFMALSDQLKERYTLSFLPFHNFKIALSEDKEDKEDKEDNTSHLQFLSLFQIQSEIVDLIGNLLSDAPSDISRSTMVSGSRFPDDKKRQLLMMLALRYWNKELYGLPSQPLTYIEKANALIFYDDLATNKQLLDQLENSHPMNRLFRAFFSESDISSEGQEKINDFFKKYITTLSDSSFFLISHSPFASNPLMFRQLDSQLGDTKNGYTFWKIIFTFLHLLTDHTNLQGSLEQRAALEEYLRELTQDSVLPLTYRKFLGVIFKNLGDRLVSKPEHYNFWLECIEQTAECHR